MDFTYIRAPTSPMTKTQLPHPPGTSGRHHDISLYSFLFKINKEFLINLTSQRRFSKFPRLMNIRSTLTSMAQDQREGLGCYCSEWSGID